VTATLVVDTRRALLAAVIRAMAHGAVHHASFNQALAAQLGIGPTDLECLTLLQGLGPSAAGQLAEVLGLTTGAVTGVVDRLAAAGFVVRESDPADRRRVIVRTVPERMTELDHGYAPLLVSAERSFATYSEDDLRLLLDFQRRGAELMQQQTARLKSEQDLLMPTAALEAPLGAASAGALEFGNGASELRIYASERPGVLYHAAFDGAQPSAKVQDGGVTFRYRRMSPLDWGKHAGSVGLNASIPWSITLHGGVSRVVVDARGLRLRRMSIGGGANRLEVSLPSASGSVPLSIEGGVTRVQIHHPAAVPVQLRVNGGANRLDFDGQHFGAVGGDVRLASEGWELASNRYDIEVRGGASRLEVDPLQEV
jgi:DNA-binding MarR family transcriptional regulator